MIGRVLNKGQDGLPISGAGDINQVIVARVVDPQGPGARTDGPGIFQGVCDGNDRIISPVEDEDRAVDAGQAGAVIKAVEREDLDAGQCPEGGGEGTVQDQAGNRVALREVAGGAAADGAAIEADGFRRVAQGLNGVLEDTIRRGVATRLGGTAAAQSVARIVVSEDGDAAGPKGLQQVAYPAEILPVAVVVEEQRSGLTSGEKDRGDGFSVSILQEADGFVRFIARIRGGKNHPLRGKPREDIHEKINNQKGRKSELCHMEYHKLEGMEEGCHGASFKPVAIDSANVKPDPMSESVPASSLSFSAMGRTIGEPVIVDLMNRALQQPGLLSLAAGFTDNAVLPRELVGGIVAELTAAGADPGYLQYGTNQGRAGLRKLTAERLGSYPGERPDVFHPEACFLTNGSQQALYLAVQVLCDPGDILLVEEPSYFVCLEMLKGLGVRAVGIPCDAEGAFDREGLRERLAQLRASGQRERVKGIYLVSYFSNPSSRSMTLGEKQAVARVLLEEDYCIPVLEDGAYRDLYFERPHLVPSVISLPEFTDFPLLYLGTYTKPFATGLKVGFGYCTDPVWLSKMLCVKGHQDFGSAHFNQAVIERLLKGGHYEAHLARIRPHYAAKAAAMHAVLSGSGLGEAGWQWLRPEGGLIYWLRGPTRIDTRMGGAFCEACIGQGVLYVPGDLCFPGGEPHNCVRLSYGAIGADKLETATERFAREALRWSG